MADKVVIVEIKGDEAEPSLSQLLRGEIPQQTGLAWNFLSRYRGLRFDRLENGVGVFAVSCADRLMFPEILGLTDGRDLSSETVSEIRVCESGDRAMVSLISKAVEVSQ